MTGENPISRFAEFIVLVVLKEPCEEKAPLTLHVTIETHGHFVKALKYHAWSYPNVCEALTLLLDTIFMRFGTKLYRQVVGISMGTNFAPWLRIYSCFVMKGTLGCFFLMISGCRIILVLL